MNYNFLNELEVPILPPSIIPFDPGYDPNTFIGHIEQSHHLIKAFKISMASWIIMNENALKSKIDCLKRFKIPIIAGGGLFEIAHVRGKIDQYLDLCSRVGFDIIEVSQGFTKSILDPIFIVSTAKKYNLSVQYEIGEKLGGAFNTKDISSYIQAAKQWLRSGAIQIVIEAREDAVNVGLFDTNGDLMKDLAALLLSEFEDRISLLQFEGPTKKSQFQLIDFFGSKAIISNVRLEEIIRVEIYRLGLHSKSFKN